MVALVFAILTLGTAALSSEVILDSNFQKLQNNIFIASVIGALLTTLIGLSSIFIAVRSRNLLEHIPLFFFLQLVVAFALIVTGGYNAGHAQGFQTSFAKFGGSDRIPYSVIYFGGVALAGYGATLIVITAAIGMGALTHDHHQTKRARAQATVRDNSVTDSAV